MSSLRQLSETRRRNLRDLRALLSDPDVPRPARLLMLQGQRGPGVQQGLAAGLATRLGPAQCAVTGVAALLVVQSWLYVALALIATVGAVSSHHPVEWVQVWWARGRGGTPLPANRAARRFACGLGAAFFAAAGVALVVDASLAFWLFAVSMVVIPAFVTVTNLCLPSMTFTLIFGVERATAPTLGSLLPRRFRLGGTSAQPAG